MAHKFIYFSNDGTHNYPGPSVDNKCLDIQLNENTIQNQIKFPKVTKPTNEKSYCKALGTSVKNSPMSPSSLFIIRFL